jgi:predicted ATPase with chaperone activity
MDSRRVSTALCRDPPPPIPDIAEVRGQFGVNRALEIAADGGHWLLMLRLPICRLQG